MTFLYTEPITKVLWLHLSAYNWKISGIISHFFCKWLFKSDIVKSAQNEGEGAFIWTAG